MLASNGSLDYQDDYRISYQLDWFTHDDCQLTEYTLIKRDPVIPGQSGETVVEGNIIYRKGVISVERKLLKPDGIAGYVINGFFKVRSSDSFSEKNHLGKIVRVRNLVQGTSKTFYEYSARIIAIVDDTTAILDPPGQEGTAFIQLGFGYEIVAESYSSELGFFELKNPYKKKKDPFAFHLDNGCSDEIVGAISDGSGWADNTDNFSVWYDVDVYGNISIPTGSTGLTFMSVWGAET